MNCPGLTEVSELLKKTKYACNALRLLVLLVEHDGVVVVSALAPPLFAQPNTTANRISTRPFFVAMAKNDSKSQPNCHSNVQFRFIYCYFLQKKSEI